MVRGWAAIGALLELLFLGNPFVFREPTGLKMSHKWHFTTFSSLEGVFLVWLIAAPRHQLCQHFPESGFRLHEYIFEWCALNYDRETPVSAAHHPKRHETRLLLHGVSHVGFEPW